MDQLQTEHRSVLRRLDHLESRLASRVADHRRRAINLIEETPTSRKSHMRILVSHRVEDGAAADAEKIEKKAAAAPAAHAAPPTAAAATGRPGGKDFSALLHSSAHPQAEAAEAKKPTPPPQPKKGVRKWTLVVEGGLLVKHFDHRSAKAADARREAGLPILGRDADDADADDLGPPRAAGTPHKAGIPLRDQWRGGIAEPENEADLAPLKFTHFFDRLEVELAAYKRTRGAADPAETAAVTRSGLGAVPDAPPPPPVADVQAFTWERATANTPDAHAFFVAFSEESEFRPMGGKVFKSEFNVGRITAKVKLYRRQSDEGNYVPSPAMCGVFFPTFIGKKSAGELKNKDRSGKSKKRKRAGGGGGGGGEKPSRSTSSVLPEPEASAASLSSALPGKETGATKPSSAAAAAAGTGAAEPAAPADEKDVHVPPAVTMDEALHAIFFYIRTRNLQDATDLSIINNDETLAQLFGCSRMLFSAVQGLLLEKALLAKVEACAQPIVFNYEMTAEGAEPAGARRGVGASAHGDAAEGPTRTRSAHHEHDNARSEAEPRDSAPSQTMLSCDVDIDVPCLFHTRICDILRHTKYREFEYTSGRIKALRALVATRVDEDTAKLVLEDVVTGKGYAPYHRPAWMALAKGSHDRGEAQRAAWIDVRTASLMEKLEQQCSMARGWYELLESIHTLAHEPVSK